MYRALYRKWRPQRFEDVVAQRGIVTALRNQVASGRVGHAYLFTGVRGTGKTTCAKIFAKAVNCLHPHNGDPCGECEICRGIDNGSILDVVEMDAASNNGVDDIRDLRDETAYTPSACHYKVYIIDEVHMLSTAAFNALLKTLEEPPAHVIFILATTEIQKVPATILSRCQRYDFTRIGPEDIAQRVEYIAGQEGLELTTGGAELISRLADGAMRDALSILDTCAGVTAKIDADVVRRMAGVTDRSYLFHISDALEAQDGAAALAQLAALRQQSVDVKRLTEELIAHLEAHQGAVALIAALRGEAVGAVEVAGVGDVEAERLDHRLAVLEVESHVLVDVGSPKLAGGFQRGHVLETLAQVGLGDVGAVGILCQHSGHDLVGRVFFVHCNDVVSHVVHDMDRAAAAVQHDVISVQLILMYHFILQSIIAIKKCRPAKAA